MNCYPVLRSTSQKILCTTHCYEGDYEDRVKRLERDLKYERERNRELSARLMALQRIEQALNRGKIQQVVEAQTYWLQEKIWKQRHMLNQLQRARKGFDPELIIHEPEEPGDLVIQEVA
jgi:predicted RNase H-like nuclease (RuvC/YqgF family)